MTDQPTFADLEYRHKSRGLSGADGMSDTLGDVGGAHPAPLL